MNFFEFCKRGQGDFGGADAHDAAVLLVEGMDEVDSCTGYDGQLERKIAEECVEGAGDRAKRRS